MSDRRMTDRKIRNPFLAPSAPTLADAITRLQADQSLSSDRYRDMCSGLRSVARLMESDLSDIPAHMGELRAGLDRVHPDVAGISVKRLQNIKSDASAALRHLGLNKVPHTAKVVLTGDWSDLYQRPSKKRLTSGLSRLIRYCFATGIGPTEVNDEAIGEFMIAVREHTLIEKPNDLHRRTCRIWNEAVEKVAGWPQQRLSVPDYRKPRSTLALSTFSTDFQTDVRRYLNWLRGDDPFAEHAPPTRCAPRTIGQRKAHIELAASAYVSRGHNIDDFQSLADLVEPERVKEILRAYVERDKTDFARALATTLILIAKLYVRAEPALVEELKAIPRKLGPQQKGMTEKNRASMRQFEDDANLLRLLELPEIL